MCGLAKGLYNYIYILPRLSLDSWSWWYSNNARLSLSCLYGYDNKTKQIKVKKYFSFHWQVITQTERQTDKQHMTGNAYTFTLGNIIKCIRIKIKYTTKFSRYRKDQITAHFSKFSYVQHVFIFTKNFWFHYGHLTQDINALLHVSSLCMVLSIMLNII